MATLRILQLVMGLGAAASIGAAQTPGDSADAPSLSLLELLEQTSGVRVETTSAALGSLGIRIQGLPGQYTQVLVDGLPLFGAQFGGLGFVQVSALDIERVDVIKGPATALYGPSALGGIVNLISRPPDNRREVVLNQTSQQGTDAMAWVSNRLNDHWGLSVLGGVHRQGLADLNNDAWADVPGFRRVELRPRLFWTGNRGSSLVATIGGMSEARSGGTVPQTTLPDGEPLTASANTNRADAGVVGVFPIATDTLTIRSSAVSEWGRETYGPFTFLYVEHGRHETVFSEATLTIPRHGVTWAVGAGYEHDAFHSPELVGFEYSYDTPSLLAQATFTPSRRLTLTANGRCDWQSAYGTTCTPRVAASFEGPRAWQVRLSGATGFFAPTPFLDETAGIALARLVPFNTRVITVCSPSLCARDSGEVGTTAPFSLQAQRARYGSVDIAGHIGRVRMTATFFAARVEHPLIVSELNPFNEHPQIVNAPGPTRAAGADLVGVYAHRAWRVAVAYTYVHSTMFSGATASSVETPLTPRHSGALDVAWKAALGRTRLAFHADYEGRQVVFDDPYRSITPRYATIALRAAHRLGAVDVYINGENLGDVRQTHYDPLLTVAPRAELNATTEVWAPLEGRVINAGIRVAF